MIRPHDRVGIALVACLLVGVASAGDEPLARRVPGWGEVVDPSRDCKVSHDPSRDRLTISVPGTPHVLSAEVAGMPLSAPRVVQSVYGDFKATVRAVGRLEPGSSKSTHYDPYHGAGLVVWKDDRNYLRLERAVATIRGRSTPYLNYEQRRDGRLTLSLGIPIEDHPIHLKIDRVDGVVRAWRSPDGSKWSLLPDLPASMINRVEVGVVAINSSSRLLRAELERFRIDTSSGAEEPRESTVQPTSKPAGTAGDRRASK